MSEQEASVDAKDSSTSADQDFLVENRINLALLDPARWGWTAGGGIADLLTPHERARRKSSKKVLIQNRPGRKRARREAFYSIHEVNDSSPLLSGIKTTNFQNGFAPLLTTDALSLPMEQTCNLLIDNIDESTNKTNSDIDLPSYDNKEAKSSKKSTKKLPSRIRFRSLQDDGNSLEINTYHRGREGYEFRDAQTGDLVCDTNIQTDTQFGIDTEPKTQTTLVTIKVPLNDDECSSNIQSEHDITRIMNARENNEIDDKRDSIRYYEETIRWNLFDSESPTPMTFASNLAIEFGLSYIQTLDLAESIQDQLQRFIQETFTYVAPVALRGVLSSSPSQHLLDLPPAPVVPQMYGEVTGSQHFSGFCQPVSQRLKLQKQSQSPASLNIMSTIRTVCKVPETGKVKGVNVNTGSNIKSKGKISNKKKIFRPTEESTNTEDIYYVEVRARLYNASVNDIKSRDSKNILFYPQQCCHICQEETVECGVFACGILSHAYCKNHLIEKVNSQIAHDYSMHFCPICSLTCDCIECVKKLSLVALDFKRQSLKQNATPETTVFENLFEHCKLIKTNETKSNAETVLMTDKRRKGKITRRCSDEFFSQSVQVLKVQAIEFPREVADGVDLDYGYEIDYKTIYTAQGPFIANSHLGNIASDSNIEKSNVGQIGSDSLEPLPTGMIEDGNVDYCNICRKVGNLICCDYCPRAFHNDCLPSEESDSTLNDMKKWECPCCREEKNAQPEDVITGDNALDAIRSAFSGPENWVINDAKVLNLLCILYEMLQRLVNYDFGYMFRHPVDCKQIPSYRTIVKKPMDLGTITSNVIKGVYTKNFATTENVVDDVMLEILKDLELVWHNCFIFNVEGSAVYRMAEVQRNKATIIMKASIKHLVSASVQEKLTEFIGACVEDRGTVRLERPDSTTTMKEAVNPRQKAKHKIVGTSPNRGGKGRPVAILDPDTGRIVKIYATMQSACNVVNFFFELKFNCEVTKDQISALNKLRAFILLSKNDATQRLFGYRWLLLEDLRGRRVAFPPLTKIIKKLKIRPKDSHTSKFCKAKVPIAEYDQQEFAHMSGIVQMTDGENIYVFNSIEESLSYPRLQSNIDARRAQLLNLSPGIEFTDIHDRKWKRIELTTLKTIGSLFVSDEKAKVAEVLQLHFIKEDILSGVMLTGFSSLDAVFQDWLDTLDAAIFDVEDRTMHTFQTQFLDQIRSVDGITWRTVNLGISETASTSQDISLQEIPEQRRDLILMDCEPISPQRLDIADINQNNSSKNGVIHFSDSEVVEPCVGESLTDSVSNDLAGQHLVNRSVAAKENQILDESLHPSQRNAPAVR